MCLMSSPKTPKAPPPPPEKTDPEIQNEVSRSRKLQRLAIGRSATIFTSGLGDTSPVSTQRATLLGS